MATVTVLATGHVIPHDVVGAELDYYRGEINTVGGYRIDRRTYAPSPPRPVIGHDSTNWYTPGGSHRVKILGPSRGRWGAKCRDCSWTVGQHYATVDEARERADGHRLFTHATGSFLCAQPGCSACTTIRRIRGERGLTDCPEPTPAERLAARRAEPLRHLGSPAPDMELRPVTNWGIW